MPTIRGCVRGHRTGLSAGESSRVILKTAVTEALGSVIMHAMTCPIAASEALTEDLVVLGNPDVIPRYYSLLLRWCADVRGAREGDKGSCLPQCRRKKKQQHHDHCYHVRSVGS